MGRLDGQVAVITGGASGIGEATARLFVAEGARVVLADVQDERGAKLAAELGASAVYQHADVAREADVAGMMRRAQEAFGGLDVLFNNAGFGGTHGPVEAIPIDELDDTMAVLFRGVFLGMKHAAPVLKAQRRGAILSTASVAGLWGGLGPHVYSAAKAAVIHLTRCVAIELAEHGVRVNCICPGGVVTPLLTRALGEDAAARDTVAGALARVQPIRRAGLPEDVARAALWLASEESGFVTGHALVVDGGMTSGRALDSAMPERAREWQPMRRPGSA